MSQSQTAQSAELSGAEHGYLDDMFRDNEHARCTVTHADSLETHTHTDTRHPDLLDIFFGSDVRRVNQGAHDLQVAVDNKGLIRPVGVDSDSPVVVHRVRQLATLPQHLVVTLKLAGVGRLSERQRRGCTDKLCFRCFWKIRSTK